METQNKQFKPMPVLLREAIEALTKATDEISENRQKIASMSADMEVISTSLIETKSELTTIKSELVKTNETQEKQVDSMLTYILG